MIPTGMSFTEIIVAIVGVLGSFAGAYLIYKRGSSADAAAQEIVATGQVYTGYGGLLDRIEADNAEIRRRLDIAEVKLNECIEGRRELVVKIIELEKLIADK